MERPPRRAVPVALAATAIAAVVLAWTVPAFRPLPFFAHDSASYIQWHPGRTPGYPLFLSALARVSPDLRAVGPAQLAVFLAAAIWMTAGFERVFRVGPAAIGLGAAIMLNPQVSGYAFTVLPESLFMSALMVHAGAVMRLLSGDGARAAPALVAGTAAATAILLKPSGYSLVPCLIVLAWLLRPGTRRLALWAATPVAVLWLSASGWNYARWGVFATQAYGGFSLVGHVAMFLEPDSAPEYPGLARDIAGDLAPVRRDLARIESLDVYALLWAAQYHHVFAEVVRPRIEAYVAGHYAPERAFVRVNEVSQAIGAAAVRTEPARYARHLLANVSALWLMPNVVNRSAMDGFEARLRRARTDGPSITRDPIAYRALPAPVFWTFKGALVLVLLGATIWPIGCLIGRNRSPAHRSLAYAGLVLHANFLLVGAVQPGLPRYALALWPMTMVVLAGTLAEAGRQAAGLRSHAP